MESPAAGGIRQLCSGSPWIFVISAVAVAIKSGKGTGCPCLLLQGESSHSCPALGQLGQDWGDVLRTNSTILGKSRMWMSRVRPRQGPLPKPLWNGVELRGPSTGAPKTWDNPQQGMGGAFPFPVPPVGAVGAKFPIPLGSAAAPGPLCPLPTPTLAPQGVQVAQGPPRCCQHSCSGPGRWQQLRGMWCPGAEPWERCGCRGARAGSPRGWGCGAPPCPPHHLPVHPSLLHWGHWCSAHGCASVAVPQFPTSRWPGWERSKDC